MPYWGCEWPERDELLLRKLHRAALFPRYLPPPLAKPSAASNLQESLSGQQPHPQGLISRAVVFRRGAVRFVYLYIPPNETRENIHFFGQA